MEEAKKDALARPLKVLVPLIKEEIEAGESAGLEHYRAAGEMLLEAKAQIAHGAFSLWFEKQGFPWSLRQARRYMTVAENDASESKRPPAADLTLTEAIGEQPTRERSGAAIWVQPVREVVQRVDVEALAREARARGTEEKLLRDLAYQLIDIGYKVLASKLHPDKPGGSAEAMARLNKVRKIAKEAF